jgi:hypothetical protein
MSAGQAMADTVAAANNTAAAMCDFFNIIIYSCSNRFGRWQCHAEIKKKAGLPTAGQAYIRQEWNRGAVGLIKSRQCQAISGSSICPADGSNAQGVTAV